jgi:hypothetical protein
VSSSGIKAGRAYVELFLKDTLPKGLEAAQRRLAAWAKGLAVIGGGMQAMSASVLTPLLAAAHDFAGQGSALNDLNAATGVSVEELSALNFAAEQTGTSLEGLHGALKGLAKFTGLVNGGSKQAAKTLQALGISSSAFLAATPTQRLAMIADGLDKIKDPGLRASFAMKTLGKAGEAMLPMLAGGSAGLKELTDRAAELGIVITGEEAAKADALGDSWDELGRVWRTISFVVGAALADSLQTIISVVLTASVATIDFVRNNQWLIVTLASAAVVLGIVGGVLLGLAGASLVLSGVMMGLNMIVGFAMGLWSALGTIKTIVAAINTWLSATLTAEGLAALFAAIQTSILSGALAVLAGVASAAGAVLAFIASPLGLIAIGVVAVTAAIVVGVGAFLLYTEAGQRMSSQLMEGLATLWGTAQATFAGIFDAIIAGRWDLAGKVAMAGLTVAWRTGVATLMNIWATFKEWMINLFAGMFDTIFQGLAGFHQRIVDAINSVREQMGLEKIQGLQIVNKITTVGGRATDAMRRSAANERKRVEAEGKASVWAAGGELGLAVTEAKSARLEQAWKRKEKLRGILDLAFNMPFNNPEVHPGGASLGTFSSAVAGLLGRSAPSSAQERTAKATEAMQEHLEAMREKFDDLEGLVFE